MSKSPAEKQAYAIRREQRLSRLKTAAVLLPFYLGTGRDFEQAVKAAVMGADGLIAEVDRTGKDVQP